MEGGREDATDHEVLIGGIEQGAPVVATVAERAFAELRVGVAGDGDSGLHGCDDERTVVEGVVAGGDELVFDGLGRQVLVGGDGAVVGDDAGDALGLVCSAGRGGLISLRLLLGE